MQIKYDQQMMQLLKKEQALKDQVEAEKKIKELESQQQKYVKEMQVKQKKLEKELERKREEKEKEI